MGFYTFFACFPFLFLLSHSTASCPKGFSPSIGGHQAFCFQVIALDGSAETVDFSHGADVCKNESGSLASLQQAEAEMQKDQQGKVRLPNRIFDPAELWVINNDSYCTSVRISGGGYTVDTPDCMDHLDGAFCVAVKSGTKTCKWLENECKYVENDAVTPYRCGCDGCLPEQETYCAHWQKRQKETPAVTHEDKTGSSQEIVTDARNVIGVKMDVATPTSGGKGGKQVGSILLMLFAAVLLVHNVLNF